MSTLKTYTSINKNEQNSTFAISVMRDVFERQHGKVDDMHRHDFYTIIVIKKGRGTHTIDFNEYKLGENQIFFIAPGQVHQLLEKAPSNGYAITFSNEFLVENAIDLAFIENLNLFNNYGHSPALVLKPAEFDEVFSFCKKMFELQQSNSLYKALSVGSYLKLLLIKCNSSCTLSDLKALSLTAAQHLMRNFKAMVEGNFKTKHATQYYADQLNITPDYLNRTVKSQIGKTAKEYIQSRITTEAKRLICFSELSNKEIGYALGFNEPSNFSHFFKNCTKQSPTAFKNSLKTI